MSPHSEKTANCRSPDLSLFPIEMSMWIGGKKPNPNQTHFSEGNTFWLDNNQLPRKKIKSPQKEKSRESKRLCAVGLCLCRRVSLPAAASSCTAGGGPGAAAPAADSSSTCGHRSWTWQVSSFQHPFLDLPAGVTQLPKARFPSPPLICVCKTRGQKYPSKLAGSRIGAIFLFFVS